MPITVAEALRGGTIEVPTLQGTKKIKVAAGTRHGSIQRLRGEGAPKPGGKGRGDIRYRLEIELPKELTEEQRRPPTSWPSRSTAPTRAPSCCGRRRDERADFIFSRWSKWNARCDRECAANESRSRSTTSRACS